MLLAALLRRQLANLQSAKLLERFCRHYKCSLNILRLSNKLRLIVARLLARCSDLCFLGNNIHVPDNLEKDIQEILFDIWVGLLAAVRSAYAGRAANWRKTNLASETRTRLRRSRNTAACSGVASHS